MTIQIGVKETKQKELIYIPTIGVKNNTASFEKLMEWACSNGVVRSFNPKETEFITIYSDFKNSEVLVSSSPSISERVSITLIISEN